MADRFLKLDEVRINRENVVLGRNTAVKLLIRADLSNRYPLAYAGDKKYAHKWLQRSLWALWRRVKRGVGCL
jgi:hypothetical protein